jgi:Ala-tRNA(Pro) deacylase
MYVMDLLRSRRVFFETLLHTPTSSASKLAGSLHVPGREVAKSVLVKAGDGFVLAVLPTTSQVDLGLLGAALQVDSERLRLATQEEIEVIFHDCEAGAIHPFGQLYGLRTIVDKSMATVGVMACGANTRHVGLRMRSSDYMAVEGPMLANFQQSIASPPSRRPSGSRQRRAG